MDNAGNEGTATSDASTSPRPQKYTVKTDGSGNYTVIQSAIDATTDGDTVLVYDGTYTENIDYSGKNLIIIGENRETTIIDGNQRIYFAVCRARIVFTPENDCCQLSMELCNFRA